MHSKLQSQAEYFDSEVTVQVRDANTGKVVDEARGKNFIANQTMRYAKYLQRSVYSSGISTLNSPNTDYAPHAPVNVMVLTDSTKTPDAVNEWMMPGKMVGYANKTTYAGPDAYLGNPNGPDLLSVPASGNTPASSKWEFDWPTQAALGSINSVGWCYSPYNLNADSGAGATSRLLLASTMEKSYSTLNTWTYFCRKTDGTASFGCMSGSSTIYRLKQDYTQDNTFSVAAYFASVRGIAWDENNQQLWVIGDKLGSPSIRQIAAFNPTVGNIVITPITIQTPRNYIALTYDGQKLWSLTQDGSLNHTLWSLNTSTGEDVTNFSFTTALFANYYQTYGGPDLACGLCWDPSEQRLWVRTYSTRTYYAGWYSSPALYAFDTSGNSKSPDIAVMPSSSTVGISNSFNPLGSCMNSQADFDIVDSSQFAMPAALSSNKFVYHLRGTGLGSRYKLDNTVVKNNTQTLKVIYTVTYR